MKQRVTPFSGEEKTLYKGSQDFFHKSAARFKETLALRKDNSKNDPSAVSGKASVWFYLRQNRLNAISAMLNAARMLPNQVYLRFNSWFFVS
jgi:hypothetical protein